MMKPYFRECYYEVYYPIYRCSYEEFLQRYANGERFEND